MLTGRPPAGGDDGAAASVLVADDEPDMLDVLTAFLREAGHRPTAVTGGGVALERLQSESFDLVLTDIHMPDATGVDVLRAVRERDLDTPVILVTGDPNVTTAVEALELGAFGYLTKPVPAKALLAKVSAALGMVRLTRLRRLALAELGGAAHFLADRAGLESVFTRAQDGMWMAYQPVVRSSDGTFFGQEALLRTSAPDVPHPGAFLDAAQRLRRLPELGRRVRARVARDVSALNGSVLVNLHPLDLTDPVLGTEADPLSMHAERVVLEITERAALEDLGEVRRVIARLRARGFRIAVDDLGAGYAALSHFASLEPDIVKLDMSLIRGIDAHRTRRKLAESIARLCRELDILVVAEGVETRAEHDVLVAAGCDLLQGFLLGRPMPLQPA